VQARRGSPKGFAVRSRENEEFIMRILSSTLLAGALLGAAVMVMPSTVSATPLGAGLSGSVAAQAQASPLVEVQYRRRYYRRGGNIGAGIAAGVGAAIIGGIIASQPGPYYGPGYYAPAPVYGPPPVGDADAYCFSRFRSYDPSTGTYLGNDGYRHPCP
jgi:hypothetical protein